MAYGATLERFGERSWPRVLPVIPIAVVPALLVTANGGYFPSSWGWAAVGFGWLAALGLSMGRSRAGHGVVMLAALAAFTVWTFASAAWASSSTDAIAEGERVLVFLLGVLAFLVLIRRETLEATVVLTVLAISVVCTYSLATRLFPDHFGPADPIGGYRLARPVGYWNGLGIYAVIALALAVGRIAQAERRVRVILAIPIPVLAVTAYFTYSRGAAIAFGVALGAIFVLDPDRMQWFGRTLLIGAVGGIGVLVASQSAGLTTIGSSLPTVAMEGHRLATLLVLLCLVSALEAIAPPRVFALPWRLERIATAIVSLAAVSAIGYVIYLGGGPVATLHKFEGSSPRTNGDLNARLFSFSGSSRAPLWSIAWHEYESNPILGGGGGSYETYYLHARKQPVKVRNAHNLYLETLAELGPIGLLLLGVALFAPLVAAWRARAAPFVPALAGAYLGFLVHMAVDWDWQLTGVAVTGLFCGAGILVAAQHEDRPWPAGVHRAVIGGTGVGIAAALVVLAGNVSLSHAMDAARRGDWSASERDAKRALTWAPWSSEPRRLIGEAQLGLGDPHAASQTFREAIARSPEDWNLWFDLARAAVGPARLAALAQAARLNPLSPEIRELRAELRAQGVITIAPKSASSGQ